MAGFTTLLAVYVVGGVTFLPLVAISIFLLGLYTFPYREDIDDATSHARSDLVQSGDDVTALEATLNTTRERKDKLRSSQDADEAAGYFAVCRDYFPMGVSAKPIERTTSAGTTTITAPSQSIYQTMYRGIFERRSGPSPIENNNPISQRSKKTGNVYYVILRHGHLMLFDNEDQAEVRLVISLLLHDISIYSGGEETPEGELFIKRTAICLSRKPDNKATIDGTLPKPFYLFSDNCSAKEDFYFSLLRNQDQVLGGNTKAPRPLQFETKKIIDLVRKLYEVDDHRETRWLNALLGRLFLGVYQTKDLERFICRLITKKISRIKRPSFLTHIVVRRIETGDSAPFIFNPQLKNLTVQGECVVEADIRYTGNFRIEIATTAKMDIGHFTKEVTLVLAVVLKKVEGHALLKIKPPPSNRLWYTFNHMPKMEMSIEPIVSSRQITWTLILNQIENRIREVVAETLVYPFWDDTPFFNTAHKMWRGGIWDDDNAVQLPENLEAAAAEEGNVDEVEKYEQSSGRIEVTMGENEGQEKRQSATSNLGISTLASTIPAPSPSPGLFSRRLTGKVFSSSKSNTSSTSVEPRSPPLSSRAPRTGSFSTAPIPIVTTSTTNAEAFKPDTPPESMNVVSRMASISSKSQYTQEPPPPEKEAALVPNLPAAASPSPKPVRGKAASIRSVSSREDDLEDTPSAPNRTFSLLTNSTANTSSTDVGSAASSPVSSKFSLRGHGNTSSRKGFFSRKDDSQPLSPSFGMSGQLASSGADAKKNTTLAAVSNAALQARQWGLNALKRQDKNQDGEGQIDLRQPMGRGQPLPPPGMPLPMPDRKTPTAPIPLNKRNLIPPLGKEHGDIGHPLHHQSDGSLGRDNRQENNESYNNCGTTSTREIDRKMMSRRHVPPMSLPTNRHVNHSALESQDQDAILVVAAPEVSEPTTPLTPDIQAIPRPWSSEQETANSTATRKDTDVPNRDVTLHTDFPQTTADLPPFRQEKHPTSHPRNASVSSRISYSSLYKPTADVSSPPRIDSDDDFSGWMETQDFEGLDVEPPPIPSFSTTHPDTQSRITSQIAENNPPDLEST